MQELLIFDENAATNATDELTRRVITAGRALSLLSHIHATIDRGPLTTGLGRFFMSPKPIYSAGDLPLYNSTEDLRDLVTDQTTGEILSTCSVGVEDEEYPYIEYFGPPEDMANVMLTIHDRMLQWQTHLVLEQTVGHELAHAS